MKNLLLIFLLFFPIISYSQISPTTVNDTIFTTNINTITFSWKNNDINVGPIDSIAVFLNDGSFFPQQFLSTIAGEYSINENGNAIFNPYSNFSGKDSVQYFVCNDAGISAFNYCDTSWIFVFKLDSSIQGNITLTNTSPLQNSKVYLIEYFSVADSVFAQDSTLTDANGFYQFTNGFNNAYVKAVPDFNSYPNEIPTYSINSPVFQNAIAVNYTGTTTIVDFTTIAEINPGGNGFIGGIVGNGAGKNSAVGQPISGLSLVLMNANNEVVKQTTTNLSGEFSFDDLEENTFSLWVDKAGVLNNLAPSLSLAENNHQDDLKFILHKTYLENITTVGIENIKESSFNIYPNPTNGVLIISNSNQEKYHVEIINLLGETLFISDNKINTTSINLDKLNFSKGTYFLRIHSKDSSFVSKIVYR